MLTTRNLKLALALAFFAIPIAFANSAGPSPGYTGAPGEFTCRNCHTSFPLNDGTGQIVLEGVPATYEPGATYTVTVRLSHPDRRRWGFQLVALDGSLAQAGTLSVVDATRTQVKTDDGKTYVEHKTAGTFAGTSGGASWSVRWTAPDTSAGVVTFYAAGNAANNNNVQTGDNIYTTFVDSAPSSASPPFEDVTAEAGLASAGGAGVAWADFDGDGDQDFYVARGERDLLFQFANGRYMEVGESVGIDVSDASRSAAWGDYDGDGRADLFVATEAGPRLYRNGAAGFEDASDAIPLGGPATAGAWADYDGDGRLDLFVLLDSGGALLRNVGEGFEEVTEGAGLSEIAAPRSAAWADYDGDGRFDLFVATASGGRLFRGVNGGTFVDTTAAAGISATAGSRDAAWGDYDGDGYLDLFVAADASFRLFRNDGDGTFENATAAAGLGSARGHAIALDDADGDGRLDLLAAEPAGVRLMRLEASVYVDATEAVGLGAVEGDAVVWADYDGDGHVDLLVLSAAGAELWRNPSTTASATVRAVTDGDGDATDATTSDDRDAPGATVSFDTGSGAIQLRVVNGGGSSAQPPARAVFSTAFATSATVRATFADGEGREREVTTGSGVAVELADPSASRVEAVSVKLKNGQNRLLVDGPGFATSRELVEVDGRALGTTKYPKKKRLSNGTSTRITGTDPDFDARVPRGRTVRVTTYDPQTGARSAPFAFTR